MKRAVAILLSIGALAGCGDGGGGSSTPPPDFEVVTAELGVAELPNLPTGRPADLSLLDSAERLVVEQADARAPGLRMRDLELWFEHGGEQISITQVRHGFPFGFPLELRRFSDPDDLEWFADTMADHFSVAVLESDAKWALVERERGQLNYEGVDANVAFAESHGFVVKGHTLLWGIVPPFSSSGVPAWALERFADVPLDAEREEELRELVRTFVIESVSRYRGRLAIWDVTNETLQPLAQWFIDRLGPGIVNDAFRWAHDADPDVTLLFNEWIVEVFTGFENPTAADVRDRVLELLADGVPIDAIGQQAHFTPAAAFAGLPVDFSQRTRIDDYAEALDTLAEVGLPIHITETNFIAPAEPERRAAQAEALMRLWWGHPAVEQIVFWGPWNKVAGRDEFDVGFWNDDRTLSRHGEAVLSLLNERWRTNEVVVSGADGRVDLRAYLGDYVAEWSEAGQRYHARFTIEKGDGPAQLALVKPEG